MKLIATITTMVALIVLAGCTTGQVKTAQSFGLSFSYKTNEACPKLTNNGQKITKYINTAQCFVQHSDEQAEVIDLSEELAELEPILSQLTSLRDDIDVTAKSFCELRDSGVKKVKDDDPLFDRYFSLVEQSESFNASDGLRVKTQRVTDKINAKIKSIVTELAKTDETKAKELAGGFSVCKIQS